MTPRGQVSTRDGIRNEIKRTSAQERRSDLFIHSFGNLDRKVAGRSIVVGVTSLSVLAVLQSALIRGAPCLLAVVFVVGLASVALTARVALSTDTDKITDLVTRVLAGSANCANDLVPDDCRVFRWTPAGSQGVDITTADAACVNLDIDIVVLEGSRSVRVLL